MDQTRPDYQNVLSQLAGAIVGHGVIYFIAIGSLVAILRLLANTSFVDCPWLCRRVAEDGYLPGTFCDPGPPSRLLCRDCVVGGHGRIAVDGVWRDYRPADPAIRGGRVYGLHVLTTRHGAPLAAATRGQSNAPAHQRHWRHGDRTIDGQLRDEGAVALGGLQAPIAVIPLQRWHRLADKAVRYALTLPQKLIAIHLTKLEGAEGEEHVGRLRRQWRDDVERPSQAAGLPRPRLIIPPSPYRSFAGRLLKHISEIEAQHPGRPVLVEIPEVVREHWWDYVLLDSLRVRKLRTALLRHGGPNLLVVTVPWAREEPHPEEVIEAEEPQLEAPATAEAEQV